MSTLVNGLNLKNLMFTRGYGDFELNPLTVDTYANKRDFKFSIIYIFVNFRPH